MDKNKQPTKPLDLDEEEQTMGVEDISAEEAEPITQLPPYVPPRKSTAKVTKDLDSLKYRVFTPLIPNEVPVEGALLGQVPFLNREDCDLGEHSKFLQLEPSKYLKSVYYEEAGFTRLEPMKWASEIEHA